MENFIWYHHYLIFSIEVDDFNNIDVVSIDRVEPIEITSLDDTIDPRRPLNTYFLNNRIKVVDYENNESIMNNPYKYWKDIPKISKDDFIRCTVKQDGVVKKLAIRLGKNLTTNHA